MIEYALLNYQKLITALLEHLQIVGITILASVLLAVPISFIVSRNKVLRGVIFTILLVIYCIPSIALFSLLIPFFGLGMGTALIGLTAYNQILLVRTMTTAFKSISPAIVEAADSIGMTRLQKFKLIDLPLTMPHFIAGLRVATVSTTGITVVAALINAGGLGNILFEGMRTSHMPKLIWSTVLISGLALLINSLFSILEDKAINLASGNNVVDKQSQAQIKQV